MRVYPELATPRRGGPFTVHRAQGGVDAMACVDLKSRRFVLPALRHGPVHAQSCYLHELAHCRWSPRGGPASIPDVSSDAICAAEDARIQLGLLRLGLPCRTDATRSASIAAQLRYDLDPRRRALLLVALIGHEPDAGRLLDPAHPDLAFARRARDFLLAETPTFGHVAPFESAVAVARMIDDAYPPDPYDDASPQRAFCTGTVGGTALGETGFDPSHFDPATFDPGEALARWDDERGARPGRMKVVTLPLLPLRKFGYRRKVSVTDEGSIVRSIHRLPIDGRIFRRIRKRGHAGSILLDVSGSMSLSASEIQSLVLQAAPQTVTAAYYSGVATFGKLVIVSGPKGLARNFELYNHQMGGNVIDAPALTWLAEQPEPRYWISDGAVSGRGDCASSAMDELCDRICVAGRITRYRWIEETPLCPQ